MSSSPITDFASSEPNVRPTLIECIPHIRTPSFVHLDSRQDDDRTYRLVLHRMEWNWECMHPTHTNPFHLWVKQIEIDRTYGDGARVAAMMIDNGSLRQAYRYDMAIKFGVDADQRSLETIDEWPNIKRSLDHIHDIIIPLPVATGSSLILDMEKDLKSFLSYVHPLRYETAKQLIQCYEEWRAPLEKSIDFEQINEIVFLDANKNQLTNIRGTYDAWNWLVYEPHVRYFLFAGH